MKLRNRLQGFFLPVITGIVVLSFLFTVPLSMNSFADASESPMSEPEWYLNVPDGPGLANAGKGNDTTAAVLDAVGKIAQSLDSKIKRKEVQYKNKSNQEFIRLLADHNFDTVSVRTMTENYAEMINNRDYSGLNQRIVLVKFGHGDTDCKYRYYAEEVSGSVSTTSFAEPDDCSLPRLTRTLKQVGFEITRTHQNMVQSYVLIRYQP